MRLSIVLLDGILLLCAAMLAYVGRTPPALSILAATGIIAGWQWLLFDCLRLAGGSTLRVESRFRKNQYLQMGLQLTLYTYWGLYWTSVAGYAPLIIVQLVFAYAIEMMLSWSRREVWGVGFGPIPIVFSTNLFLWFREDYFFLQLMLIVTVYLCKEFLRWNRDGRSVHIFNPSAIALALASAGMLLSRQLGLSHGVDIVETFTLPPNMYETIFLLGLVVQFNFSTTPISLGALIAQCLLFALAIVVTGVPISPVPVNVSVFLALTLLVTDPSTSPRTSLGKFLFGATYGAGVFMFDVGLRMIQLPSFVDKILMVPVVNVLVPAFDRLGDAWERREPGWAWQRIRPGERYIWLALYTGLFLCVLPSLKQPFLKPEGLPLPPAATRSSPPVTRVIHNMEYARRTHPNPYRSFGYLSEISEFPMIRRIYENGAAADSP